MGEIYLTAHAYQIPAIVYVLTASHSLTHSHSNQTMTYEHLLTSSPLGAVGSLLQPPLHPSFTN